MDRVWNHTIIQICFHTYEGCIWNLQNIQFFRNWTGCIIWLMNAVIRLPCDRDCLIVPILYCYIVGTACPGNRLYATDICKYTLMNKQTVNSSVKKLHHDELFSFRPDNERKRRVYLTNKDEVLVKEKYFLLRKLKMRFLRKWLSGNSSKFCVWSPEIWNHFSASLKNF